MRFVKQKHGSVLHSISQFLLNIVMLLGPFDEWKGGRRLKFVVSKEAAERVPYRSVSLDPRRITQVFKAGDRYYVAYDTDRVDFYRNYLARLPPDAEELRELRAKIGCVVEGRRIYSVDDCWELEMAGEPVEWIERTYWRRSESPPPIEVQGESEVTLVTKNNLRYVVEKLFGDSSWNEYYWTPSGHSWVEFIKKLEEKDVRVGESTLKYVRGLGYVEHSSYEEIPWTTKFGEHECVTLPRLRDIMYCRFKPNKEVVRELSSRNYSLFLKNIDKLREQYGDEVLDYIVWRDKDAPLLVRKFPEKFRDKLNEIAEKVVEMLRENPRLYEERLPEEFYGYRYLSSWVKILERLKQYLRPELAEELEEAKRRAEELVEAERERARREEGERKRREIERIRRELGQWSNYIELVPEDSKLVVKRKRYMSREMFSRLVRKLKELRFRFDPRTKEWFKYILSVFRI